MSEDAPTAGNSPDSTKQRNGSLGSPTTNGGPSPNPRSCVTCRRRKVKCDKKNPCSNCVRAKTECVFPGPGRAPRKSRKPPDAELLERLRRLEGVVSSLNAQVEEHEQEAAGRERQTSISEPSCPYASAQTNPNAPRPSVSVDNSVEGLENRFGRLVIEKGRSRYINNSFWASLNSEVEDLKTILDEPTDDEDEVHSPDTTSQSQQHHGFILGYSSVSVDMSVLRPSEALASQFWAIFKENVDPIVKCLHIPTFEPVFRDAIAHPEKVSKPLEPLLFAIYYGAVTSTAAEDCIPMWGETRNALLQRYRFGLEQALARANFLYCDEVVILQAFVIFLILLRRNDEARKIWTLTGLVVRIAQTLGIHRDGSHFNLPPFEIEMRRRLWWQVCILDARSSEDHGCDPTIVEAQFDTRMPLNVNDTDLTTPDMTDFPTERKGFTDMTFCLLRFEVANIFRRILYIPPAPNSCTDYFANLTILDKEKWITKAHTRMEEKYLKDCDMSIPLCWVTATVSRLIMSKMWLIVYHPYQRKDGGANLPQETKDKLFITSLENIEYSILLETEARTMKWGWLFRTYVQWHAIAFLLSELCVRTKGEAVERAWRALEATAGRWCFPSNESGPNRKGQPGALWKPLRKLLAKAKAARGRELALERASKALCSGKQMFAGFPQGLEEMRLPPLSVEQPSSDELDRMLRPAAPKLGEPVQLSSRPSWPTTILPLPNGQRPLPNMNNESNEQIYQSPKTPSSTTISHGSGQHNNAGHDFPSLMNYGFDNIMIDVMGDMAYDGTSLDDPQNYLPSNTNGGIGKPMMQPTGLPNTASNNTNTIATNYQQNFGTFGDNSLGNINFGELSPTMGQKSDSPSMDGAAGMDWTMWDDMVAQYGMEGINANTTNPASNIGLTNWF